MRVPAWGENYKHKADRYQTYTLHVLDMHYKSRTTEEINTCAVNTCVIQMFYIFNTHKNTNMRITCVAQFVM